MRLRHLSARARPLLVAAGLTLIAAALLIAYLQRRHEAEQRAQTAIISQQICERTAALLAPYETGDPIGPPPGGPAGMPLRSKEQLAELAGGAGG